MSYTNTRYSRTTGSYTVTAEPALAFVPQQPVVFPQQIEHSSPPSFDYRLASGQLNTILHRYTLWQDPLSLKMFRWGTQLLEWGLNTLSAQMPRGACLEGEALNAVGVHIRELSRRILLDNYDWRPLENPVLVNGSIVWDQRTWNDYCQVIRDLPPNIPPVQALTALCHDFAIDMISWRNSLPEILLRPVSEQGAVPSNSLTVTSQSSLTNCHYDPYAAMMKLMCYKHCTGNSMNQLSLEGLGGAIQDGTVLLENVRQIAERIIRVETNRVQANLQAHERMIDTKLSTIETVHRITVEGLQRAIEIERQQVIALQQRLDACDRAQAAQREEAQRLQQAVQQKNQEVSDLERRVREERKKSCIIL